MKTCTSTTLWYWYPFQQLSCEQLYVLLRLRQEVFIIEQQCIYPDIDGLDLKCLHLLGYQNELLVAYLRLIPAEIHSSGNISLGRIITSPANRGVGIGEALMQQAMQYIAQTYQQQDVQIAAQFHLQTFYQKFGFTSISEPYDEDGIEHVDMLYTHRT